MPIQRKPISIPSNQGGCCGKSYVQRQLITGGNTPLPPSCCPPPTTIEFGVFDGASPIESLEMNFQQWCQTSLLISFQYSGVSRSTSLFYEQSGQGYFLADYTSTILFDINNNTTDTLRWKLESTTPVLIEIFAENITCAINYGKVGQLQII
tara:strand:- start:9549 stop:10004 length:456 start_codon:yes stop_codon:yes gene_type:complete